MGKLVGNYRYMATKTSAGATETFIGDEVPRGTLAILTFLSVQDYTTNALKFVLAIRDRMAVDHYIEVEQGTAQNKHYGISIQAPLILFEGERPIGIVESASASDVCYFAAHGGLYTLDGGGVP